MMSIAQVGADDTATGGSSGLGVGASRDRSTIDRSLFGATDQPRWARPALLALLTVTAVLYLWNLTISGWGNEFYAATAQAGTQSWKALLFGSIDPGNAITVDKPPAAMWVMGLSGRLFGFNAWSLLAPQALMGVGSVALLYAAVRRCTGAAAGLLAGAALAATPVAAMMFRYDNPDALLTLLLIAAAYCTVRAVESGCTRWLSAPTGWLALAGVAVGFAFLTKLLQAMLVLPALGAVFLVAGAGGIASRLGKLVTACAAMVVSGGWYLLLVQLWPAGSRPYIGGSTDNSLWQLTVGYNGLGRLLGGDGNSGGGSSDGPSGGPVGFSLGGAFGGETGLTRLFRDLMGTEGSWLLPAALIGLGAGLWITRRAPRTDLTRAALILWGGWLLGTGLVFSYMSGTIHPYYTVALAPGIAATAGVAVVLLWRHRTHFAARLTLAGMSAVTGVWAFVLLDRTPQWLPWLRWIVVIGSVAVAVALTVAAHRAGRGRFLIACTAVVLAFAGTGVYTVETATQAHSGGIPSSGPPRLDPMLNFGGSGGKNPFGSTEPNLELDRLLTATDSRWAAATIASMLATNLELRTGTSIMAIGGFSGGDNSPTLEQFQHYVADHQIHYLILNNDVGGFRGPGFDQNNSSAQIEAWVKANYPSSTVGDVLVYDLMR